MTAQGNPVLPYPWSTLGYFVAGSLGALAFLAVTLMFEKGFSILPIIPLSDSTSLQHLRKLTRRLRTRVLIYGLMGGVVSLFLNVAASPDFGPNQYAIAFAAGAGWPAVMIGIGAGKQVSEANQARVQDVQKVEERGATLRDTAIEDVKSFFEKRLQAMQKLIDDKDRELQKVVQYYSKRLAGAGGGKT